MCLYSRIILNPKYKPNKKNRGQTPPIVDERIKYIPIGCGECIECRKKKANEWKTRLLEDIRTNAGGTMVTLTFSNESFTELAKKVRWLYHPKKRSNKKFKYPKHYFVKLPKAIRRNAIMHEGYELDNAVATKGVRMFTERWRKEFKKAPRHWLITELGHQGTENVHLHGIVWSRERKAIEKHWKYGFIWPREDYQMKTNYVNEETVGYLIKYVTKLDQDHKFYKPVILNSKGIGSNYINRLDARYNKFKGADTKETYTTREGAKIALPIYWRNKIYTEAEREQLWIQKLDKCERWVLGVKIDARNTDEFFGAIKHAQKINRELGYGNGKIDWERKQYESQLREINHSKRMKNMPPAAPSAGPAPGRAGPSG